MSREAFLARVRQAAQSGRSYRVHLGEIAQPNGCAGHGDADLCARMAAEVREAGGMAHPAGDLDAAREQLLDLLDDYQVGSVLLWRHELLDRLGLKQVLCDAGIEALDYERLLEMDKPSARAAYLAADVGVTSCDYAVAETGSLVVCSRPGQERIASLVPPVHIAVVERSQILPDLFDIPWDEFGGTPGRLPSNISLITGPSKTGDIELMLTTGVHGPGKWHVVIIA